LPHDAGSVTAISTATGVSEYGESEPTVSVASYVPGWSTCEESVPTVTVQLAEWESESEPEASYHQPWFVGPGRKRASSPSYEAVGSARLVP
jgi:hypothetical protein